MFVGLSWSRAADGDIVGDRGAAWPSRAREQRRRGPRCHAVTLTSPALRQQRSARRRAVTARPVPVTASPWNGPLPASLPPAAAAAAAALVGAAARSGWRGHAGHPCQPARPHRPARCRRRKRGASRSLKGRWKSVGRPVTLRCYRLFRQHPHLSWKGLFLPAEGFFPGFPCRDPPPGLPRCERSAEPSFAALGTRDRPRSVT